MTLAMKFKEEREIADMSRVVSTVKAGRSVFEENSLIRILKLSRTQYDKLVALIDANPDMGRLGHRV